MFTSLIFVKKVNRGKPRGHKGVSLRIPGGLFRSGLCPDRKKARYVQTLTLHAVYRGMKLGYIFSADKTTLQILLCSAGFLL